jgi:hypothetical protein
LASTRHAACGIPSHTERFPFKVAEPRMLVLPARLAQDEERGGPAAVKREAEEDWGW